MMNNLTNLTETNNAGPSNSKRTLRKRKAEYDSSTGEGKRKSIKKGYGSSATKRKIRPRKEKRDETKKRMERAMNEPIHLIDFKEINPTKQEYSILGPTGYVYTTTITTTVTCSCPDFQKGNHCKHILFVFLKVLKVDKDSNLIYQKALITRELKLVFKNSSKITLQPSKEIVDQLKAIASSNQQKRKPIKGDCQICCERLNNQKNLIWCENGCGHNLHLDCFKQWEETLPVGQKVKYQL
ncbi:hypothetical protein Glove_367g28 [Diversispora epigaea]|uniref:SWIM-type domain-containing protein n=1 Tax=Diversispora epigaea TaxID=1348612 RepID=A0A397HBC0_9GLOM|nr:hypothetical protein Glove_367g28 [Diversispora epigaea]